MDPTDTTATTQPIPRDRYRLGIATRILGAPIRPHDSRRWQQQPHLSVSLAYVRDILTYLESQEIRFYRLSSQLAPYATHPALPQFHRQIVEAAGDLAAVGDMARAAGVRLTMHPAPYVQLAAADETQAQRAAQELAVAARLLDGMGLGAEGVLVVHVGQGRANENTAPEQALARFARRFDALDPAARARLAVENDDRVFDLHSLLWLHKRTGVRLVLDTLHHRCLNRAGLSLVEALGAALATWPAHETPKIHVSSPRTELRVTRRHGRTVLQAPLPNQHSDFVNAFEFIDLLRATRDARLRPFDVMLEAKAHDLALLRLRTQVAEFAPALAPLIT
jgi:UV DNA damage endonuclease